MQWFSRLSSFLHNLLRRGPRERELDTELDSYIEEQAARNAAGGMGWAEALRQARLEAGGVQQLKEQVLAARAGFWLQTFWQDVRYTAHRMRQRPGLTLACVLTFAVGIGANTAIVSMVNALVLRPMHAYQPDRLTFFVARLGSGWDNGFSVPDFLDIRKQSRDAFADVAGIQQFQREGLSFEGRAQTMWVDYVSTNFFSLMGVNPALGSFFAANGRINADQPALVLSYSFWKTQFGADPEIIGKTAFVDGQAVTIIGVAEEGFHGAAGLINTQGFLPLGIADRLRHGTNARRLDDREYQRLLVIGRLQNGISREKANSVLAVIARRLASEYPSSHKGLAIRAVALGIGFTNSTGENPMPLVSALFLTLAGIVLLLAAGNVMNLLLVQAAARTRETALRSALGAARARLIRQSLTETALMVCLGSIAGMAMGVAAAHLLGAMRLLGEFPIVLDFSMDWRVFTSALLMAIAVAVTAGLTPAWRASRVNAIEVLREGGRQASPRRQRLHTFLVISQVTGSLTLLIVAGLFVRSLRNVERRDLGFDPRQVMDFSLDPHGAGYDQNRGREFYAQLENRIQSLPGVETAALALAAPLDAETNGAELEVDGEKLDEGHRPQADYDSVSPEFLKTLRIQLLRGREFSDADTEIAPRVAIVNEVMAQRLWPGQDPIGRQFKRLDDPGHVMNVIGVVRNAQMENVLELPGPFFFMPLAQNYVSQQTLIVRASGAPAGITQPIIQLIRQIDSAVPVYNVAPMSQNLDGIDGFLLFRLGAGLASALGLLGFMLAVIGVYGVTSYSAAQRSREIAIRIALGAQPVQVIFATIRQALLIVISGVIAGIFAAIAIAKLVGSFLVSVSPFDPVTYVGVSALLAAIALLASFLPALRASRVDPGLVLRQE